MTRELSPEERAFVEEALSLESQETKTLSRKPQLKKVAVDSKSVTLPNARRKRAKRSLQLRKMSLVFIILPIFVGGIFLYVMSQIPASLGGLENIELLQSLSTLDSTGELAEVSNFGWIENFNWIFERRFLIIGSIFALFIFAAAATFAWDVVRNKGASRDASKE